MGAFDKVIGYETVRQRLVRTADALKNTERYAALGVCPPRGLLLYGEPGVGKTLMARCLIEESGRPAFTCRKEQSDGEFVGAIKEAFAQAAEQAPAIMLLDDLDKFADTDRRNSNAEEYVAVQSCIDEVGESGVFVLATANDISCLPDSLLRSGRLGDRVNVACPQAEDAEKIIGHYLARNRHVGPVDCGMLARLLRGRSCADLEEAVNAAGLLAGYERMESITMEHLIRAILQTLHGVSGRDRRFFEGEDSYRERERLAYHEAGHAVVAEAIERGSVTLVSIFSKGRGEPNGITIAEPLHDSPDSLCREQASALVCLGSRAAVERQLGFIDCGANRDCDQAFNMIRQMVSRAGCCGFDLRETPHRGTSELESRVEQAVAAEVERCYHSAMRAIARNSGLLDALAGTLLEKEFVMMDDIARLEEEHELVPLAL